MTPPALSDLIACGDAEEIMAGLCRLGRARFDDIRARVDLLARYYFTGRAEDLDALAPADRAAMLTPAADPEVIRYAQAILAAIHRDMDRTPAGSEPIPRDVGSFAQLQDYRDTGQYLILLIPYDPDDCTCGRAGKGDAHGDGCPAARDGGSWDRWTQLTSAVAAEVSRLLAVEAAAIHDHRSDAAPGEVAGLQAAMLAAAEITDLPSRFTVEPQPGQPRLIIRDQVSGRHALVPLFAYGAVREALAALFPGEPAGSAQACGRPGGQP